VRAKSPRPTPRRRGSSTRMCRRSPPFAVCMPAMTGEHLDAILKAAGAKGEKDGWHVLPEGSAMTLHVAHDGASMTVSRVDAVKQDGELVYARNPRRELF